MFHIFLLSLPRTLQPWCASARQLLASSPAENTLQTKGWNPLNAHRSRFWIVWNKVHQEDLAFVQQKRMDDGDIYYHLFLCTYEHFLVGSSCKLMQEAAMMKVVFPVGKSVTRRGLLVMCLVAWVSCVRAKAVSPPKEKLVIPLLFFPIYSLFVVAYVASSCVKCFLLSDRFPKKGIFPVASLRSICKSSHGFRSLDAEMFSMIRLPN